MIYFTKKSKGNYHSFYRAESIDHFAHPFVRGEYFSSFTCHNISDLIKDGYTKISEEEFNKYMLLKKLQK